MENEVDQMVIKWVKATYKVVQGIRKDNQRSVQWLFLFLYPLPAIPRPVAGSENQGNAIDIPYQLIPLNNWFVIINKIIM